MMTIADRGGEEGQDNCWKLLTKYCWHDNSEPSLTRTRCVFYIYLQWQAARACHPDIHEVEDSAKGSHRNRTVEHKLGYGIGAPSRVLAGGQTRWFATSSGAASPWEASWQLGVKAWNGGGHLGWWVVVLTFACWRGWGEQLCGLQLL